MQTDIKSKKMVVKKQPNSLGVTSGKTINKKSKSKQKDKRMKNESQDNAELQQVEKLQKKDKNNKKATFNEVVNKLKSLFDDKIKLSRTIGQSLPIADTIQIHKHKNNTNQCQSNAANKNNKINNAAAVNKKHKQKQAFSDIISNIEATLNNHHNKIKKDDKHKDTGVSNILNSAQVSCQFNKSKDKKQTKYFKRSKNNRSKSNEAQKSNNKSYSAKNTDRIYIFESVEEQSAPTTLKLSKPKHKSRKSSEKIKKNYENGDKGNSTFREIPSQRLRNQSTSRNQNRQQTFQSDHQPIVITENSKNLKKNKSSKLLKHKESKDKKSQKLLKNNEHIIKPVKSSKQKPKRHLNILTDRPKEKQSKSQQKQNPIKNNINPISQPQILNFQNPSNLFSVNKSIKQGQRIFANLQKNKHRIVSSSSENMSENQQFQSAQVSQQQQSQENYSQVQSIKSENENYFQKPNKKKIQINDLDEDQNESRQNGAMSSVIMYDVGEQGQLKFGPAIGIKSQKSGQDSSQQQEQQEQEQKANSESFCLEEMHLNSCFCIYTIEKYLLAFQQFSQHQKRLQLIKQFNENSQESEKINFPKAGFHPKTNLQQQATYQQQFEQNRSQRQEKQEKQRESVSKPKCKRIQDVMKQQQNKWLNLKVSLEKIRQCGNFNQELDKIIQEAQYNHLVLKEMEVKDIRQSNQSKLQQQPIQYHQHSQFSSEEEYDRNPRQSQRLMQQISNQQQSYCQTIKNSGKRPQNQINININITDTEIKIQSPNKTYQHKINEITKKQHPFLIKDQPNVNQTTFNLNHPQNTRIPKMIIQHTSRTSQQLNKTAQANKIEQQRLTQIVRKDIITEQMSKSQQQLQTLVNEFSQKSHFIQKQDQKIQKQTKNEFEKQKKTKLNYNEAPLQIKQKIKPNNIKQKQKQNLFKDLQLNHFISNNQSNHDLNTSSQLKSNKKIKIMQELRSPNIKKTNNNINNIKNKSNLSLNTLSNDQNSQNQHEQNNNNIYENKNKIKISLFHKNQLHTNIIYHSQGNLQLSQSKTNNKITFSPKIQSNQTHTTHIQPQQQIQFQIYPTSPNLKPDTSNNQIIDFMSNTSNNTSSCHSKTFSKQINLQSHQLKHKKYKYQDSNVYRELLPWLNDQNDHTNNNEEINIEHQSATIAPLSSPSNQIEIKQPRENPGFMIIRPKISSEPKVIVEHIIQYLLQQFIEESHTKYHHIPLFLFSFFNISPITITTNLSPHLHIQQPQHIYPHDVQQYFQSDNFEYENEYYSQPIRKNSQYILNIVESLLDYIHQDPIKYQSFIKKINNPFGIQTLKLLKMMRETMLGQENSAQYDSEQEKQKQDEQQQQPSQEQSEANQYLDQDQLQIINRQEIQSFDQSLISQFHSSQHICYNQQIFNQSIYDCINIILDELRPYGNVGMPSINFMHKYKNNPQAGNQQHYDKKLHRKIKFQKVKNFVTNQFYKRFIHTPYIHLESSQQQNQNNFEHEVQLAQHSINKIIKSYIEEISNTFNGMANEDSVFLIKFETIHEIQEQLFIQEISIINQLILKKTAQNK